MSVKVRRVQPHSPAERAGVLAGDVVTSVARVTVSDYLDVELAISGEAEVELAVGRGGEELSLLLNRSSSQGELLPAGFELEFSPRICPNRCIFCFVDQNLPGLRRSIYVKDEDYRLSFSDGAYITLTNLTAEDKARISALRLSPLYVSVHTTDDRLRRKILGNPKAEPIIPALKELVGLGVSVHSQVVVMPGINDGAVLESAFLEELSGLDISATLTYDMLAIKTKTTKETSRRDFLITESCRN